MEDHADGVAVAGTDPADAMAQINAVGPARPLHRPMMHSKRNRVALPERNHLGPRLHSRPLLCQHELAAFEIAARLRQQDRDLQREHVLAIEVLVQAVEVAGFVLQQQRCRPGLPSLVTALEERGMRGRCSVSTNSPPSKSRPGSDRRIAACSGKTCSP